MRSWILTLSFALGAVQQAPAQQLISIADNQGATLSAGQRASIALAPPMGRKVTMKMVNVTLDQAIREVSRQAGVGFTYSREVIPTTKVSINVANIPVHTALKQMLKGTGLRASVSPTGQITLTKPERSSLLPGGVSGTVVNDKGTPIAGATVTIEGTQLSARTGDGGRYEIRGVPAGNYTLSARSLGYTKNSYAITVSDDNITNQNFTLAATANQLSTVVVTSTVAEAELKSVPVDVAVITAKQLQDKNITRIEQIFRGDVPGVFIEDQGYKNRDPLESSTPRVRGQNFLSGGFVRGGSFLKTYVDGILITDFSIVNQMDPANIERIEIVRGPAATTLYGSGASDGVMQIFTKRTGYGLRPSLSASATMFDSPYVSGMVVSPRLDAQLSGGEGAFSFSGAAMAAQEGEWVPNYRNKTYSLSGGVLWRTGPFSISTTMRNDGPNSYNSPPDPFYGLGLTNGVFARAKLPTLNIVPSSVVNTISTKTMGAEMVYYLRPTWTHTARLGSNSHTTESLRDDPRYAYLDDTLLQASVYNGATNTTFYSNTWQLGNVERVRSTLTTGFEHTYAQSSSVQLFGLSRIRGSVFSSNSSSRNDSRNTGFFAQWELGMWDALFLTAGVRGEKNPDYGSDVGVVSAPRVGMTYVLSIRDVTLRPRFSYGRASKPPSQYQKDGSPTISNPRQNTNITDIEAHLPNMNLLPAESRGGDYGLDMYFGRNLALTVSYFNQMGTHDIYQTVLRVDTVETPVSSGGTLVDITTNYQFTNIGEVQSRGVELHGTYTLGPWNLTATYTTTSNIVRSLPPQGEFAASGSRLEIGKRIPNIPTFDGGTTLSYTSGKTTINMQASYQGRYRGNDQATAFNRLYANQANAGPSFFSRELIFPMTSKYNFNLRQNVRRDLTAFLRIDNVWNTLRHEGYDNRFPMSGRVFRLGATWTKG